MSQLDVPPSSAPSPQPLTATHWLILIIASIGFAFDIYELLMLPLVLPPAAAELLAPSEIPLWRSLLFWVPAMAGGGFGLVGGYLTDLLGRRRVLTWSILLYATSAFLAGFSTSMPMLLVLRCTTFIGVCVEFVAAVAWLAELFPEHRQRERVLGYTQAFSSVGGLLVGTAFLLVNKWSAELPAIAIPEFLTGSLGEINGGHAPWRYMLMSGLIPAVPLIVIRPFLPESPIWAQKKAAGTLKRPSFAELFSPALARTTVITTLMVALSYGAAFGAIQQMPQMAPAVPQVQESIRATIAEKQGELSKLPPQKRAFAERQLVQKTAGPQAAGYTLWQEVGGLVGRFVLALLVVQIASRRALIRIFQVPGIFVMPLVFGYAVLNNQELFRVGEQAVTLLHVGMFVAGLVTVAQFSFWGNYLPVAYPVHLRGTGESVAHNVGGRMIGTSFAAITSELSSFVPGESDAVRVALTAAGVGCAVYVLGLLLSFFLPEPGEDRLRE